MNSLLICYISHWFAEYRKSRRIWSACNKRCSCSTSWWPIFLTRKRNSPRSRTSSNFWVKRWLRGPVSSLLDYRYSLFLPEKYEVTLTFDFKRKFYDIQPSWAAYLVLLDECDFMLKEKQASVWEICLANDIIINHNYPLICGCGLYKHVNFFLISNSRCGFCVPLNR